MGNTILYVYTHEKRASRLECSYKKLAATYFSTTIILRLVHGQGHVQELKCRIGIIIHRNAQRDDLLSCGAATRLPFEVEFADTPSEAEGEVSGTGVA